MKNSIITTNRNNKISKERIHTNNQLKKWDVIVVLTLLIIIWHIASLNYSPIVLPSPLLTFKTLIEIIKSEDFFLQISTTLKRLLIGLLLSITVGSILGILMGVNNKLKKIIELIVYIVQSIPPILFMTLAMIWFGLDGNATIFIVFIASVSILVINIKEGLENIDPKLIEMAKIFNFSNVQMIKDVIVPSLKTYFSSGLIVMVGLGWKLVIMGEVLSSGVGLGAQITDARVNIETNKVFAWGIVIVVFCFLLQKLVDMLFNLRNMEKRYDC